MTEWKEYKLKEIAQLEKDSWKVGDEKLPYIALEHIVEGGLRLQGIGDSNTIASNKFRFNSDCFLFGKLRPYFRKLFRPNFEGICSTDIWVVKPRGENDKDFLFYFFANQDFVDFTYSGSSGTRMPRADWNFVSESKWNFPPLPEQKAIASVLSSLDDKIDLLHRQNKTLEQMAETLFRQWFVEEADEGWEEIELRELCKVITKGTTPTSLKKSFVDSGINFIKVNCIDKNGNYLFDKFNFIDEETHFSVLKRSILKQDDILYSIAGTIGRAVTVTKNVLPANVNQALAIIRVDEEKINPTFVKYALKDKDITFNLHSKIVHAVQPNLSLGEIGSTILPMPDFTALEKFNSVVNPIEHKINFNKSNIQTLEKLRDTLLPKLMSGKVRVKMEE
jgi:type I restriction enzyme S subunit